MKANSSIVFDCKYHVVWCPKYRRSVLVDGVDVDLKQIIQDVCQETNAELIEVEVMPDHIHVLIACDPQFGINRLIKLIKGRSSNILRKKHPWLKSRLPCLWTSSYFVSTVGNMSLATIKRYIENQKRSGNV